MLVFDFIGFLTFFLVQKAATQNISQNRNPFQHEAHSTSKSANVTLSSVRRANNTDTGSCTGDPLLLTEMHGTITSPNYPGNYFNNLECQWLIRVQDGYRVKISFTYFRTESNCDILWIYDGSDDSSFLLRKISGGTSPSDVYSTKNEVFLRFRTDHERVFTGFKLNYVISCRKSSILLTEPKGYVSLPFPNINDSYERDMTCSWLIWVETGYNLNINFRNLHLESCSNCNCDNLEIYDGPSAAAALLAKLCGNNIPSDIQSTTNQVYIRFKSNGNAYYSGFYLHYRTVCFCGEGHRCEVVEGRKICYCKDKFQNNNGMCEECDCGSGYSCEFEFGKKICRSLQPLIDDDGKCQECFSSDGYKCGNIGGRKVCISVDKHEVHKWLPRECSCGNESTCVFKDGEKVCLCNQGYALKNGMCKECSCGKDSSCIFKEGEKMCLCRKGYVENDGICEECSCGNSSIFCGFEDGEKVCLCKKGYEWKDGACEVSSPQ